MLEKELVLEEISNLSDKLRNQAVGGRSGTLELAKQVNDFQARIRTTTRRIMATVSELSMYQATAMKLQQEKHELDEVVETARFNFEQGEPPTEDTEREWYQMERNRLRRQEEAVLRAQRNEMAQEMGPPGAVRTTAEPRPNAYIPDEIGIPKPYGNAAPFKPSEAGSSMRHIRKPDPRPIEL